ncbi:MAG: TetR/AcrR family transcriptional regulator [Albidovulum sp.]
MAMLNNDGETATPAKRSAAATRRRILNSARQSFARHGFRGARIEAIADGAKANVQMIYRYFGNKEGLYLEVLEDTYLRIRARERRLKLGDLPPDQGVRNLVEFTFDYLAAHPEFVAIIRNENMDGGRFARRLQKVSASATPLVETLSGLLRRGGDAGLFRKNIDTMQLYVTILALCITHLAQSHTLSVMFNQDLGNPEWIAERRAHVVDVTLSYLRVAPKAICGEDGIE